MVSLYISFLFISSSPGSSFGAGFFLFFQMKGESDSKVQNSLGYPKIRLFSHPYFTFLAALFSKKKRIMHPSLSLSLSLAEE